LFKGSHLLHQTRRVDIGNKKKISVALATYNGEKYLRELLDSVYRQSCRPYEVVVCDDGSTDGTVGILEEYARVQGLQYEVNPRNLGYIKNFEKTISLCSGDYVALCDQDDRWHPEKLTNLVNRISNYSLICSDAVVIDGSGNKIASSFRKYQSIHIPDAKKQPHSFIFGNFVMGCTSLLNNKNFISELYPFPDDIPHDWWIAMLASMCNGIKYIKKPLIDYRLHGNNIIGAPKKSVLNDIFTYRKKLRMNQNHLQTVIMIKGALVMLNELANRDLADLWMLSVTKDLQALLDDFDNSPSKHQKANRIILKYLNYLCPSSNPFAKLMMVIENFYK